MKKIKDFKVSKEELEKEYIRKKIEEGERSGISEDFNSEEFLKEIKKSYKKKNKTI